MQSPRYNLMYAQSIPALNPYLDKIDTSDPAAVLTLLTTYSNYDFGSAACEYILKRILFIEGTDNADL